MSSLSSLSIPQQKYKLAYLGVGQEWFEITTRIPTSLIISYTDLLYTILRSLYSRKLHILLFLDRIVDTSSL